MSKIVLIVINIIRFSVRKLFFYNSFSVNPIQKISLFSKLIVGNNARLRIEGRNTIRGNTEIKVFDSGNIYIRGNVFINKNCMIIAKKYIEIGVGTTIGPNTLIYDHDHDMKKTDSYDKEKIVIGDNVWIAGNVTILKGVKIGDRAVIGAGTIVTKDVPNDTLLLQKRENSYFELGGAKIERNIGKSKK